MNFCDIVLTLGRERPMAARRISELFDLAMLNGVP